MSHPWLTTFLKRKIRQRKRAYKKARRTHLENHWLKFKTLRNEVIDLIRNSKKQYFDSIAKKLKSKSLSPKDWWATLKTFITPTFASNIPPLENNGHIVTDEYEKANIFNTYFQSQTILDDSNAILPDLPPPTYHTQLNRIVITPLEVESILKTLKLGKASGPNGLNNRVLKELSKELSSPLCSLFNQSLRHGVFPASYKIAHVSPVPKKGDLSQVSNHRPISLLNTEGKVFERLVFKHLFNHLQDNNCCLLFSQASFPVTRQSTNWRIYIIHFVRPWTLERKFELSSATSARHLIVSGMMGLYTNSRLLVSREKLFFGLEIIFPTDDNELCYQGLHLTG